MAADQVVPVALLLFAAGAASLTLSALLLTHCARTPRLVDMTVGTTIFCASVGLAFQRFGPIAGLSALAVGWIVNRGVARSRRAEQFGAWTSAAAFLAFLSQI